MGKKKKLRTVNLGLAKAQLSELVDRAAEGEPFIIVKAGKPLVMVTPVDATPPLSKKRIGFMEGMVKAPDDFDTMHGSEIVELFEGLESSD